MRHDTRMTSLFTNCTFVTLRMTRLEAGRSQQRNLRRRYCHDPYLKDLGITAVEFMPVHQCDPQEGSHWGYMPLAFFAPHHLYARDGDAHAAATEFREMVDALHAAGIEVILDVVYNHTAEGDHTGPTYSFRGIDNPSYYALDPGNVSRYVSFSACGNDLRTAHPLVRMLVLDSLHYWATEMNVDGFRFDLASIFHARAGMALSTTMTLPSSQRLAAIWGSRTSVSSLNRGKVSPEPGTCWAAPFPGWPGNSGTEGFVTRFAASSRETKASLQR